jgi:PKHD-type hydroxylase
MTCNLSLPNEYTGGNLKFDFGPHHVGGRYHEVEEIRPQGSVVVFPSWLPHCVTPVETGVRYSLVLWSLGRPLK